MKKHTPYSYCIFYLERKYCDKINKELKEKGYDQIKAIIPMVNVLRKTTRVRWYSKKYQYYSITVYENAN